MLIDQPTVSIVIVNWNGRHWLQRCLPAIAAQTYPAFEIIVVDNGSTDGSVEWLREQWPHVYVLRQEHNLGFALANNIGIRASQSPYVVTLNNDTRVDPGWLETLVRAAAAPDVGMVASCILRWNQPDVLDSAGIEVDVTGTAWNRGWGRPVAWAVDPGDVFGPSAAAALYHRQMLNDIGLFDEDFFAYYEDVDLAWRAQRAGWRCRYAPAARVWHWHSATGQQKPELKLFLLGRNKIWTILKNYHGPALFPALPLIVAADTLAIMYQTARTGNLAALRGRASALRQARHMLAKRTPARRPVKLVPFYKSPVYGHHSSDRTFPQ